MGLRRSLKVPWLVVLVYLLVALIVKYAVKDWIDMSFHQLMAIHYHGDWFEPAANAVNDATTLK